MDTKTLILYDGNCIVCDMEIQHYKRLAPETFDIQDICHPDFDASLYGLTKEAVNKHMHVITPEKNVKIGVDAFVHIWERLERFQLARKIIKWPIIFTLARVAYEVFARYIRPILPKKNAV